MSRQHYHPETFEPQLCIGYLVKRAHLLMLDAMEPLFVAHGFTFTQYMILSWLKAGIAVNPKDICIQFRHDSGAMTRVIDQLADRGLVDRVRRGPDRRKVELQLTQAGRETVAAMVPLIVDSLNAALADFSTTEVEEFSRLLLKLNASLLSSVEAPLETAAG